MIDASKSVQDFDVGALAEAACDARDVGSFDAVLAVLRCILRTGASVDDCHSSIKDSTPGFCGAVFLSAIYLVGDRMPLVKSILEDGGTGMDESDASKGSTVSESDLKDVQEIFKDGYRSIVHLGNDVAFATEDERDSTLQYVSDAAWNLGGFCGAKRWHCLWRDFFELSGSLSSLAQQSREVLETRQVCYVMCATASVEKIEAGLDDASAYATALGFVEKAKSMQIEITKACGIKPLRDVEESLEKVQLLIHNLEAQCYGGLRDQKRLALLIEEVKERPKSDPDLLQRLASIAFDSRAPSSTSEEQKYLRLQNAATCLNAAIDALLLMPKIDLKRCSSLLRDLLGIQLCIVTSSNLAFLTLKRSMGLMEEHTDFPNEERRWITRTAWDTAEMHCKTGRVSEAKRWAEAAIKCAAGNPGLSTYIPRIQRFIEEL